MKKLCLFIYIIVVLMSFNINIKASQIKCVYGNLTITYDTNSNNFNVTSSSSNIKYDHKLTPTNFTTNDNKLTCLDKIYVVSYITNSNRTLTYELSAYSKDAMKVDGKPYSLDLDKSNSNVVNDENKPEDEIIECKYSSGDYTASLRYNKNTKEIQKVPGKCTELNTDLKESNFSSGECPAAKLITDSGRSGTGVYCNISANYGGASSPSKEDTGSNIQLQNNLGPFKFKIPELGEGSGFGKKANCKQVLGTNGYRIVNGLISIVRILAPIVAILVAMIDLLPGVTTKDEKKIKESTRKCVTIGIVLLVIEVIPYIVRLIGAIFEFDLTCIG